MKVYGEISEGKPVIFNIDGYREFFSKLDEKEQFEIKLTKVKDIRSIQMNNLYWAWLADLSLHSGYTKRELHNYFKEQLLCKETTVNGVHVFDCESTADLSIKEFSHYLSEVARLAAQQFSFVLKSLSDAL